MRRILCILCVLAISFAALPAFAMEMTEFTSRCTMGLQMGNSEMCGDKDTICGSFMDAMAKTKDKASCKQACSNSDAAIRPKHVMDGCEPAVQHAYDECTIYCEGLQ